MTYPIDINKVVVTEFGVGVDQDKGRTYFVIPIDSNVQSALLEMAEETWRLMNNNSTNPQTYLPSEKYSSNEHLVLPTDNEMISSISQLHNANNIPENTSVLSRTDDIFSYFARFIDDQGKRWTAVRRSTQFKGVLKKKLLRFGDDTLKIVPDSVFKLDNDFDFLVDSELIHIYRPSGLEFTAHLQKEIMAAVKTNIHDISAEINFVNFDSISQYAQKHPRAARYLASIRSQSEAQDVTMNKLTTFCTKTGVELSKVNGQISVDDKHIMGFLEVLDRRRYEVDLTDQDPELFKAASRSKIVNSGK